MTCEEALPKLEISASRKGEYWRIDFQDNGIGIDESHWQRVFDPLCRLNPESDFAGSGLGLSISKRIVEMHGGTIALKSSDDGGTKVSFDLIAVK